MDETSEDYKSPNLKHSDYSLDSSSTIGASPSSLLHLRPTYHRITSNEVDTSYKGSGSEVHNSERDDQLELSSSFGIVAKDFEGSSYGHGLGIGNVETRRPQSISQAAFDSNNNRSTPLSADPLLSPSSTSIGRDSPGLDRRFKEDEPNHGGRGPNESNSAVYEPFAASSDRERLHGNSLPTPEVHFTALERSGENPEFEYRTPQRLHHGRVHWLSITILMLAIYSTVFSGVWLAVALIRPRWGRHITTNGKLPPATASLLCAAFAKSIELSFVTVFVAFLGQVLSRRAYTNQSKGITIAEMSMRAWVMQPGTMITHWQTVRYAAFSFLGVISLFAALMAMLYTTASDALVAPKLKYGDMESRQLYGKVATSFANPNYIKSHCKTPITKAMDDDLDRENTCAEIEYAGQSYHNYQQYLIQWTNNINSGNGSDSLMKRPRPVGMLYDNTTVQGSWIHEQNVTTLFQNFQNRIINNISMAMPHAGVFSAARDPLNNIIQPQDLNGLGEYVIRASVPSPVVNVICANAADHELDPLVYETWPNATLNKEASLNITTWPENHYLPNATTWLDQNKTALDEVFQWGGNYARQRPVFAKYPLPYNTIVNSSKSYADTIYLLGTTATGNSTVCSIRGSLTPNCSTEYRASTSGGILNTRCEDPNDALSYHRSDTNATNGILDYDWINIAISWITALSLNTGISDGQASNSRLLTQLILANPALNPSLPSIAEALAELAGCTLLLSTLDSPFIHYWNYSDTVPTLEDPQYQAFNASLRFQDYASGGTQQWQNMFYIVLLVIFVTNVVCLAYLCLCRGLVTDFIEPQNLFSISLNSPPSKSLEGSFGGGPEKEQLETNWVIKRREQDQFYIQEGETQPVRRKRQEPLDYEMQSPLGKMYSKLASTRNSMF
ncbi:hypothetical protein MMC29_003811 [Sticta canariensis]|nr:hypothetical protein [Sticta canariensis]